MEWISVKDRLPESASRGVHDAYPVLIKIKSPHSDSGLFDIKITTWMNNRFTGYPSGATIVTHFSYLEFP